MRSRTASLFLLCALAGCGGGDTTDLPLDDCNPLGTNHCMTPWPSSAFEVEDASTATGVRLAIPQGTLPTNGNGFAIDPSGWNTADGFSPAAPIVVSFPGGVSDANLVGHDDFAASLTDASPTVLVDMTTGERVVHFAELDAPAADNPDHQALFVRPAARLIGGHRYAVGLQKTLRAADGSELERPAGFQRLLDGTSPSDEHPLLEKMRPGFPDVLAALDGVGVAADDLLLAWDFTVASDDFILGDVLSARDQALAALDATPQGYEVFGDEVVDDGSVIAHKIEGEFDAPLFLTNDGRYNTGTLLARDSAGAPALQGTYRAPFTAIIPTCAYTAPAPVGIMIYGHGLMGDAGQVASGAVRDTAAEACVVAIGTDMRGMSTMDIGSVATALSDLNFSDAVFPLLVQGIINHVALVRVAQLAMAADLFVDDGGASLVDPAKVYYYGLSQGGIFGTTVIAVDPVIQRGVTGVGAGNYSLMLERSADWPQYRTIVTGAYPDPLDLVLIINLMQMRWDHTEAAGFAHVVTTGSPLGISPKQVLVQMALGDEQVPNLATEWEARSMGIPVLTPSPSEPYGLATADGPITGSALVIMDGGAPPVPAANIPAPDTGQHNLTRNQPASRRQIATFFETGSITNECDGACVCPAQCQ
jgi:hypothetical protein